MLGLPCVMNELEIKNILSKQLGHRFKGVFSKDELQALGCHRDCFYVINTQPSHVQFGHWVGIYIKKNRNALFFDSFGRSPQNLGFSHFLDQHAKSWRYNNVPVQSPFSAVCGGHTICFLLNVNAVETWINSFSYDLLSNDVLICEMMKKKFGVILNLYPDIELFM